MILTVAVSSDSTELKKVYIEIDENLTDKKITKMINEAVTDCDVEI